MTGNLKRQPYVVFEIDVPKCSRVYGSSPCTAALSERFPSKCYNTRATCADPANYDGSVVETRRFVKSIDGMPKKAGYFPMLKSVSTRPAEINLSGFDPNSIALGTRASGTAVLADARDNGSFTDPYLEDRKSGAAGLDGVGIDPAVTGTHWGKFIAQFPYYVGNSCRVKRGYVGDDPDDMLTEHYFITAIKGPDASGRVSIEYKDVLDLTEKGKALWPKVSSGKLLADLDDEATSFTITPEGTGDLSYAESGIVRIGDELMSFARSGDVFTVSRGQEGTDAQSHSELDLVQECVVYESGERICEVAADILLGVGVPSSQVPLSTWQATEDEWLSGTTIRRTILSEPQGAASLIGELCQLGVMFYPDVRNGVIAYRVNAPLSVGETYYSINHDIDVKEDSAQVMRAEKSRVNTVIIVHGIKSWTGSATSGANFDKGTVATVNENLYDQDATKIIYVRWFGREGNDPAASVISERLLTRFRDTPKRFEGILDAKDRDGVDLGARISITSRLFQDANGLGDTQFMQSYYVEPIEGEAVRFKAETYSLDGKFAFWLDANTDQMDYNLATDQQKAEGAYWWDENDPDFETESYVYF